MGFRFRKSINLGGFRINLSKSGIGYSFGVKGLRYTHKAGGGTRTTIGIPNTGLSYVKDSSAHKKKQTNVSEKKEARISNEPTTEDEMIESSSCEVIDRLNRADKLNRIFLICRIVLPIAALVLLCVLYAIVSNGGKLIMETGKTIDGMAIAIVCGILAAICLGASLFFFLQKVQIELAYDFSDDALFKQEYADFLKEFSVFQSAELIWENQEDLPREKATVSFVPLEPYIKINLETKAIRLFRKQILFLPDIIAVKQQNGWAGVTYLEAEILVLDQQAEEISAPKDTTILSQRWLHARKDGNRNQRFTENYLIYNCLYGEIKLSSKNGLNADLICSSNKKAHDFCSALSKYIKFTSI